MPTDPLTGSRYPSSTASPNVNQDIQNAVIDLSDNTIPSFTSTANRDAAYSAWVSLGNSMRNGLTCFAGSTYYAYSTAGGWRAIWVDHATARADVATITLTNPDTALTGVITVPAAPIPYRVTVHASGRSGGAASARTVAWDFDSLPASATNVAKDDPANRVTVDPSVLGTVTASLSMDLPANVAGTFRLMYRANANGFNFGGLIWTRGPVV